MFRTLSVAASRAAVRSVAPRSAAVAALLRAPASAAVARSFHASAIQRAKQQEQEDEEEEEHTLVPLPQARSELLSAVTKEISAFDVSDEFSEGYVKDHGLNVKIDLASESVVATRTVEGHTIQVSFKAEVIAEEEPEEEEEEKEKEEDSMPEHRFFVDIVAPSRKIMRLECYNSAQGEMEVGNITFPTEVSPDPASVQPLTAEQAAREAEVAAREALRVDEMSEETSGALFSFLESLGINDDLAVYVSSQAQAVRTKAMIQRMEQLKSFAQ